MAGIYIHIPFCKQACNYCNFHFSTSLKQKNEFLDALLKEANLRSNYLRDQAVETIYFGGGTPSLLVVVELERILSEISSSFRLSRNPEITLEANPDDISAAKVQAWKDAGINRLSIGIQSFVAADLKWMNRAHTVGQAENAILLAKAGGIDNLTIDLIYGTPQLSDSEWISNLDKAIDAGVQHLSCYALTVEPNTLLDHQIRKKNYEEIDLEKQARQFMMMVRHLESRGFEQYEISNFALPGFRSQHNSSYWKGAHYLGLGPSAHSFNGYQRSWNVANNALYIQSVMHGIPQFEFEELTEAMRINEYIMTSCRTIEGLSLSDLEVNFGSVHKAAVEKRAFKFIERGQMLKMDNRLVLSREGRLFADGIAAELFVD